MADAAVALAVKIIGVASRAPFGWQRFLYRHMADKTFYRLLRTISFRGLRAGLLLTSSLVASPAFGICGGVALLARDTFIPRRLCTDNMTCGDALAFRRNGCVAARTSSILPAQQRAYP